VSASVKHVLWVHTQTKQVKPLANSVFLVNTQTNQVKPLAKSVAHLLPLITDKVLTSHLVDNVQLAMKMRHVDAPSKVKSSICLPEPVQIVQVAIHVDLVTAKTDFGRRIVTCANVQSAIMQLLVYLKTTHFHGTTFMTARNVQLGISILGEGITPHAIDVGGTKMMQDVIAGPRVNGSTLILGLVRRVSVTTTSPKSVEVVTVKTEL